MGTATLLPLSRLKQFRALRKPPDWQLTFEPAQPGTPVGELWPQVEVGFPPFPPPLPPVGSGPLVGAGPLVG